MIQPFGDGERVTKMNWLNYKIEIIKHRRELSIDRAKWPELARRSMNLSPLIDISPLSISNEWLSRIVVFLARARLSVHYEFWSKLTYADHVVPRKRDEVGRKWKYLHFEIIFVCCCCLLFSYVRRPNNFGRWLAHRVREEVTDMDSGEFEHIILSFGYVNSSSMHETHFQIRSIRSLLWIWY